jgi:hypothetical protein
VSALAGLTLVVAVVAGGASAAKPPKIASTQAFTLESLGLSFTLPADWGRNYGDLGSIRLAAFGPGYTATLDVIAGPTTLTLAQQVANFLAYERQRLAATSSVAEHATTIGKLPAVLVTLRQPVGPEGVGGYEFDYLLEHAGYVYVFEYDTTARWLASDKRVFAASAASIRFQDVA